MRCRELQLLGDGDAGAVIVQAVGSVVLTLSATVRITNLSFQQLGGANLLLDRAI